MDCIEKKNEDRGDSLPTCKLLMEYFVCYKITKRRNNDTSIVMTKIHNVSIYTNTKLSYLIYKIILQYLNQRFLSRNPNDFLTELFEVLHHEICDIYYNDNKKHKPFDNYYKSLGYGEWLSAFEKDNYSIIKNLFCFQIMQFWSCTNCNEQ